METKEITLRLPEALVKELQNLKEVTGIQVSQLILLAVWQVFCTTPNKSVEPSEHNSSQGN
jgi:hypothetical protein